MVDLVPCPTNLLFFDILLLYYYINLRSTIIFCLSSGDIYLSLGFSLSCSFVNDTKLFCCNFFEIFVILSGKSPVASAFFWMLLFEEVLSAFVADFPRRFSSFYWYFYPYFSKNTKVCSLLEIFDL